VPRFGRSYNVSHSTTSAPPEIDTFLKGPVCNGSIAVNSIQEQFFAFFLRPDADDMVMLAEYARRAQDLLILPGVWGSDVILDGIPFFRRAGSMLTERKMPGIYRHFCTRPRRTPRSARPAP
jgi:hypothetical protein